MARRLLQALLGQQVHAGTAAVTVLAEVWPSRGGRDLLAVVLSELLLPLPSAARVGVCVWHVSVIGDAY
jgi:hypothetical protein